jgi:hypothetical protein
MREITDASIMPWWEVLEISLADMACDCGNQYKRQLRQAMLEALGLHHNARTQSFNLTPTKTSAALN